MTLLEECIDEMDIFFQESTSFLNVVKEILYASCCIITKLTFVKMLLLGDESPKTRLYDDS
eukprot:9040061-Ditylum_brightwellii.AAC.1